MILHLCLPMADPFDLDLFITPDFQAVHSPEIERVVFLSITIVPAHYSESITLQFLVDTPQNGPELRMRLKQYVAPEYLSVHQVVLEFWFVSDVVRKNERIVRCELALPDQHNLDTSTAHQIIWQHFHRWGIYSDDKYAASAGSAKTR